jgi:hypothetical protein
LHLACGFHSEGYVLLQLIWQEEQQENDDAAPFGAIAHA